MVSHQSFRSGVSMDSRVLRYRECSSGSPTCEQVTKSCTELSDVFRAYGSVLVLVVRGGLWMLLVLRRSIAIADTGIRSIGFVLLELA
jgi:hypothetical protein